MAEVRLGDIHVERLRPDEVAALSLSSSGRVHVVSINLDHIKRFGFRALAERGGRRNVYVADGWPVALACRVVSGQSWPRCSGADYFPLVLEDAVRSGRSVLVYGSTDEVHEAARQRLTRQFGATGVLDRVTFRSPSAKQLTDRRHIEEVAESSADSGDHVIFLCLGKPKQEDWHDAAGDFVRAPTVLPVGAALEFWAGATARAPGAMQRWGLEWLHRLGRDPKRLWRRYTVEALPAALHLARVVAAETRRR